MCVILFGAVHLDFIRLVRDHTIWLSATPELLWHLRLRVADVAVIHRYIMLYLYIHYIHIFGKARKVVGSRPGIVQKMSRSSSARQLPVEAPEDPENTSHHHGESIRKYRNCARLQNKQLLQPYDGSNGSTSSYKIRCPSNPFNACSNQLLLVSQGFWPRWSSLLQNSIFEAYMVVICCNDLLWEGALGSVTWAVLSESTTQAVLHQPIHPFTHPCVYAAASRPCSHISHSKSLHENIGEKGTRDDQGRMK